MRTFFFYSVPNSTIPSPYFKRVPKILAALSRAGILRFRLWQGRHEAPVPLDDGPEPVFEEKATPILPAAHRIKPDGMDRWVKTFLTDDNREYKIRVLGEFPGTK